MKINPIKSMVFQSSITRPGKLRVGPWQSSGWGKTSETTKNWSFSGSIFIYQRVIEVFLVCLQFIHRIGWWEILQESPIYLMVKTHGFPVKIFPTKPIHWFIDLIAIISHYIAILWPCFSFNPRVHGSFSCATTL